MTSEWKALFNTSVGGYGYATDGDGNQLSCDFIDPDYITNTGFVRVKIAGTFTTGGIHQVRIYPPNTANDLVAVGDVYGRYSAYDANWFWYTPGHDFVNRLNTAQVMLQYGTPSSFLNTEGVTSGSLEYDESFGSGGNCPAYYTHSGDIIPDWNVTVMQWSKSIDWSLRSGYQYGYGLSSNNTGGASRPGITISSWSSDQLRHLLYDDGTSNSSAWINEPGVLPVNQWIHNTTTVTPTTISGWQDATKVSATNTLTGGTVGLDNIVIMPRYICIRGQVCETQVHTLERPDAWINKERLQTEDQVTMFGAWSHVDPSAGGGHSCTSTCARVMQIKRRQLHGKG